MQSVVEHKAAVNVSSIYAMRYAGATLRQIAERIGKTKERVRQILKNNYGSTKHKLVSTRQLCMLTGLSKDQVNRLSRQNVITPVRQWDTNNRRHYSLWSPAAVERVRVCLKTMPQDTHRKCKICQNPVPINRKCYCSEECYKESHKYKNRSAEARQIHLLSMKGYKKKYKRIGSSCQVAAN